jgi:membrane protein DedA with SNARE-associated domain
VSGLEETLFFFVRETYVLIGWPGVILLSAVESACIPLPSEVIMPLAGWMLIKEQGLGPLYTIIAAIAGGLGNTLGSLVAYWVGTKGGRKLLERYGRFILITHHDLQRADEWFKRYGQSTVFFSRLLPVVRTFISLPAGIAGMPLGKFTIYTFVGSYLWSWGLAYGGFLLGKHWEQLRATMRPFDIPILVAIVALTALFIFSKVRQRHAPS